VDGDPDFEALLRNFAMQPSAARIAKPPANKRGRSTEIAPGQLLVLYDMSWDAYEQIGEALRDRPSVRLTYDQGTLEIMTTSSRHERHKTVIGMLILILAEELRVAIGGYGQTTYKRQELERGLEGDQSYYTTHLWSIRHKDAIDLNRDPPPDLAVEIEVSRTAVSRMPIFARLRVPELWRYNGTTVRVYLLDAKGDYQEMERSPTFPGIPVPDLARFIRMADMKDDTTIARQFRSWVQKQLVKKKTKRKE
jgi:Uma2 family endonuclease